MLVLEKDLNRLNINLFHLWRDYYGQVPKLIGLFEIFWVICPDNGRPDD